MRRLMVGLVALALTVLMWSAPGTSASASSPLIQVAGVGVGTYPAFDPTIHRYGITTTSATGETVTITVPAGSTVNGAPASGAVTLGGLTAGDEIAVGIAGQAYGLVFLPAGFPAMATTGTPTFSGYLGVGLTTFGSIAGDSFEALLDRNGVPAWVVSGTGSDLKRQPDGELTVMRPTASGSQGYVGSDLVTLDDQLAEVARRHVAPNLTDTDNHDSERLPDGRTILVGYEPSADNTRIDATIQETDAAGHVLFQWSSAGLEDQSLNPLPWPQNSPSPRTDYAHINSVQEIPDGSHDLLVSFRHFSSVYRISTDPADQHPHHVIWRLGGRSSSFTFAPGDGGPCAQHNARWLGPDRVLVFDNGSVALGSSLAGCVDPSDPSGPGVARPYTRVSEYVLDTSAGTATLDWSYLPASTFTFFAGSATRLADGHTLVGWASDRTRLATEVDHGTPAVEDWSMWVPGNTQSVGYTSYRVSVLPYADAIRPRADLDVPDGAAYLDDQAAVVPHWRCTDRGGSTLTGCTVAGLVDGHLSTVPGQHTVSVTARDGAGNTTVLVRHYAVRTAHQPDGLVRKAGRTWWRGGNVYGSLADQTIRQDVRPGGSSTSFWRVQNDGERSDRFRLTGTVGSARMRVRYFAGTTDVTRAVLSGTYVTAPLAPGQVTTLRVVVTPTRRAHAGATRTFALRAASVAEATRTDQVGVRVTRR